MTHGEGDGEAGAERLRMIEIAIVTECSRHVTFISADEAERLAAELISAAAELRRQKGR